MKKSLKSIQQFLATDAIIDPKTQNNLKGGIGGISEPPPWGNITSNEPPPFGVEVTP